MQSPEDSLDRNNQVKCAICGEVSHPTSDCALRGKGISAAQTGGLETEYEKFLTEIGEGGVPGGQQSTENDPYKEFMAAIQDETTKTQSSSTEASSVAPPWAATSAYGTPSYGAVPPYGAPWTAPGYGASMPWTQGQPPWTDPAQQSTTTYPNTWPAQ